MAIEDSDRSIVRGLAERVAEIAALPVQKLNAAEWRRLNGLGKGKPMIFINELPWHEMNGSGELSILCEDEMCRGVEWQLRTTLYQWDHMRWDMVVEPFFRSPLALHNSGFGIHQEGRLLREDTDGVYSHEFEPQMRDEKDVDRILTPKITLDSEATERHFQTLQDLLGDILPVRKTGVSHVWFSPWDEMIRWWGVENALMDMVERPEFVHAAMDRLVNAYLAILDQWEELNALSFTDGNHRVGSGGLGISDELPAPGFDPARVRAIDQWGCATAQIFSTVSPRMHDDFALQYEKRWLARFGLTYYGCCEPLHDKLGILKTVPNLRKISMSPWANLDQAVPVIGDRYVISHKPNPAVFATDEYSRDQAKQELIEVLEKTRGCAVEIIMKDVSTTRYDPKRLWEWTDMAREVCEQYA